MVRAAWKTLGPRYHPDNLTTGNAEKFRACNDAYEILRDPGKRASYDLTLVANKSGFDPSKYASPAAYEQYRTQTAQGMGKVWKNGVGWVDTENGAHPYPGAAYHNAYGPAYPGAPDMDATFDISEIVITEELAFNLAATIGEAALQSLLKTLPAELRMMIQRVMQARRAGVNR